MSRLRQSRFLPVTVHLMGTPLPHRETVSMTTYQHQFKRTLLIVTGQYKQLIFAVVCILLKSKLLKLFVILGNDDKFQVYIRL